MDVECDLISLPLLTSTPTQCIKSEEENDIILPQDHGEDNLSQSWGDIAEEPTEADCARGTWLNKQIWPPSWAIDLRIIFLLVSPSGLVGLERGQC